MLGTPVCGYMCDRELLTWMTLVIIKGLNSNRNDS